MENVNFEIPILNEHGNAGNYGSIEFDFSDDRNAEPLVDASSAGIANESFYAREDGGNWPYNRRINGSLDQVWVRASIAEKLQRVNRHLLTFGVELYIWDAYRPISCQQGLWDFFQEKALIDMPTATQNERIAYVIQYVSDPTRFNIEDSTSWPVHTSGSAVDLTLREISSKKLLDMGAGFDDMQNVSHSDYFERRAHNGDISPKDERLINRRLLHWAMDKESFINYPFEFWHFDWGNQMYIMNLQTNLGNSPKKAWYGYTNLLLSSK